MKDLQKIKEFFSKSLEENQPQFKKGDKVTYLGHPAEITAVNKEMTGETTYSVVYDKGQGRTKASNINLKSGAIKPLEEAKEPAHLEKVRNIVNSLPHRYNIKPDRLGMVKVTSRSKDELGALKTELDKANLYSQMRPTLAGMFELTISGGSIKEAKKETAIDMAKKKLDALGVKYEMSATDKVRPFKVIYKPINKSDKFYDEFEDIVDLFNLKGVVKSSISEAKGKYKIAYNGKGFYGITNGGKIEGEYSKEEAQKKTDEKNKSMNEAKEEDAVDTITMDIPLFLRMLEYSREDASQDMDLHDVTEKANKLGKERGILSMDDYEEIVGAAEEIDEAELTEAYVPSNIKEFAKRKGVSSLVNKVAGWAEKVGSGIKGGTAIGYNYSTLILDMTYQGSEIRINTDNDTVTLYDEPVNTFNQFQRVYLEGKEGNLEEGMGGELDEPFFIRVSVRDARKAMDMFDDMYRNSNIKTYGSDVYAADTPEDIYDFFYDLNSSGIEILDANVEDDDNFYDSEYEKTLKETIKFIKENNPKATSEEVIAELKEIKRLGEQLNEELCEKGKRYIAARQAAGEKSSAYLSGRGVKVCKGQIEWPKKGKKK